MAVELFKRNDNGEVVSELFDIKRFRYHLEGGEYVLDPKEFEETYEDFLVEESIKLDENDAEEDEKLREKEPRKEEELWEEDEFKRLRLEAKEKRIIGWHQIKSVDKLREKIAGNDNQD